jgi:hypothetical protein
MMMMMMIIVGRDKGGDKKEVNRKNYGNK